MDNALKTENVSKIFNEGLHNEVTALEDISLEIGNGECVVLEGPSGSGKTTLLSLLGCMSRPTNGRVYINGEDVSLLSERFLAIQRRKEVGVVFQHFNLIEDLSAIKNVELPLLPTGRPRIERRERAQGLLEKFGLGDKSNFRVGLLSGGEKQRVALARSLINDPEIIVADEPTAHLDSELSEELMEEFGKLNDEYRTLVICTHDPIISDQPFVDRVIKVRDGKLVGKEENK